MSKQIPTVTVSARVEPSTSDKLDTLALFSGSRTKAIIDAIEFCHDNLTRDDLGKVARLKVQQNELRRSVYSPRED